VRATDSRGDWAPGRQFERNRASSAVSSIAHSIDDEPLPQRQLVFAIISLAMLMSSVDQTIVATALPTLQRDLHAQINWSSWTITIYALGQILAMPLAGALSDEYGRKRVFLIAVVIFTSASLCCGLSTSIYTLIPLRAIQALGGGAFLPSASGIVSDHYGRERDRALGMFSSIFPIGGAIGPILGGVFVTYWSWRGIFLVNVPIGIVLLILAVKFLPHTPTRPTARTDFRGVALLGGFVLSAMYGVTSLGTGHQPLWGPTFAGAEALALVMGTLFIRHLRTFAAPVIPPRLLFGKGFAVMNTINFLFGSAALGFGALVPLYAEDRYGIRSLSAGTLLTARAVGMICSAALAVVALRRTGYRPPMVVGFFTLASGLTLMAFRPPHTTPYVWLAIASGITGIGMGTLQPAANNAVMHLDPTRIAAVSGLRGMIRQCGSITAISVTTALLARNAHPGAALGHVFLVFAVLTVATVPLIFYVPDHRGSW
jgi:EmrB/QacA subfamily drug resistance transporter